MKDFSSVNHDFDGPMMNKAAHRIIDDPIFGYIDLDDPEYEYCFADILQPMDENFHVTAAGNMTYIGLLGFYVPRNEKTLEERKQEYLKSNGYVPIQTNMTSINKTGIAYVHKDFFDSPAIIRERLKGIEK